MACSARNTPGTTVGPLVETPAVAAGDSVRGDVGRVVGVGVAVGDLVRGSVGELVGGGGGGGVVVVVGVSVSTDVGELVGGGVVVAVVLVGDTVNTDVGELVGGRQCCRNCCQEVENLLRGNFGRDRCRDGCEDGVFNCGDFNFLQNRESCFMGESFRDVDVPVRTYDNNFVEHEFCCLASGQIRVDDDTDECIPPPTDFPTASPTTSPTGVPNVEPTPILPVETIAIISASAVLMLAVSAAVFFFVAKSRKSHRKNEQDQDTENGRLALEAKVVRRDGEPFFITPETSASYSPTVLNAPRMANHQRNFISQNGVQASTRFQTRPQVAQVTQHQAQTQPQWHAPPEPREVVQTSFAAPAPPRPNYPSVLLNDEDEGYREIYKNRPLGHQPDDEMSGTEEEEQEELHEQQYPYPRAAVTSLTLTEIWEGKDNANPPQQAEDEFVDEPPPPPPPLSEVDGSREGNAPVGDSLTVVLQSKANLEKKKEEQNQNVYDLLQSKKNKFKKDETVTEILQSRGFRKFRKTSPEEEEFDSDNVAVDPLTNILQSDKNRKTRSKRATQASTPETDFPVRPKTQIRRNQPDLPSPVAQVVVNVDDFPSPTHNRSQSVGSIFRPSPEYLHQQEQKQQQQQESAQQLNRPTPGIRKTPKTPGRKKGPGKIILDDEEL